MLSWITETSTSTSTYEKNSEWGQKCRCSSLRKLKGPRRHLWFKEARCWNSSSEAEALQHLCLAVHQKVRRAYLHLAIRLERQAKASEKTLAGRQLFNHHQTSLILGETTVLSSSPSINPLNQLEELLDSIQVPSIMNRPVVIKYLILLDYM